MCYYCFVGQEVLCWKAQNSNNVKRSTKKGGGAPKPGGSRSARVMATMTANTKTHEGSGIYLPIGRQQPRGVLSRVGGKRGNSEITDERCAREWNTKPCPRAATNNQDA